jgi:tripartite-type tricarboxylate transporter receptor subunit TctC
MNGADRVAKAGPDRYTFLQGTVGTQAQNQRLFKKPAYDSTKDFAPVALAVEAPLVLIARKDLPVKDMKEFVTYAKANGARIQYASAGTGSAIHLGCALVNMSAASTSSTCPTAAPIRRCSILSAAGSIISATSSPRQSRRSRPAPSSPSPS